MTHLITLSGRPSNFSSNGIVTLFLTVRDDGKVFIPPNLEILLDDFLNVDPTIKIKNCSYVRKSSWCYTSDGNFEAIAEIELPIYYNPSSEEGYYIDLSDNFRLVDEPHRFPYVYLLKDGIYSQQVADDTTSKDDFSYRGKIYRPALTKMITPVKVKNL